ncbi:hypothetical protein ABT56_12510 [Photobacterium aquae]|uniref:Uncharacterized protein n=1 Tax=Photobacterium aquae TaxID=1195763 RepID=A0A0J1H065_9GAMM|nr:hypothetical protein [Photobacterium aquae]KLV05199.1 hypothetical protein ABT56_12510 [Photobacterium aquae]
MTLRTLLGAIGILLATSSYAQPAEPLVDNIYKVQDLYGGFLQNKQLGATINLCQKEDATQCYFITLNHSSFLDLLSGFSIQNRRDNNPNLVATAQLRSMRFKLSKEQDSGLILSVVEQNDDYMKVKILIQLATPKTKPDEVTTFVRLPTSTFTIYQEDIHKLKSLLGVSLDGKEQKFSELNDCELANQIYSQTAPLMAEAMRFMTPTASQTEYYAWREKSFMPRYQALRELYDPIHYHQNRQASKIVHDDYLIALGGMVHGMANLVRYDITSVKLVDSINQINSAEFDSAYLCDRERLKKITAINLDGI